METEEVDELGHDLIVIINIECGAVEFPELLAIFGQGVGGELVVLQFSVYLGEYLGDDGVDGYGKACALYVPTLPLNP